MNSGYALVDESYFQAINKASHKALTGLKELVKTMEEWNETLEVSSDEQLMRDLRESEKQAGKNQFIKYEDLLKD